MAPRLRMAPSRLAASSSSRIHVESGQRGDKRADAFYVSPEWRAFRNALIKERGWRCEDPHCETPRGPWKQIYGDHIVELRDGGAPLDRHNVLLRCGKCHGRKTTGARMARVQGVGGINLQGEPTAVTDRKSVV